MQNIVSETHEIISNRIVYNLKHKIEPLINTCTPYKMHEIDKLFKVLDNPFSKLDTKFLRMKYLVKNILYVKPKTVVVGYTKEKN